MLGIERLQQAYFARDPDYPLGHHRAGHRRRAHRPGRRPTTSPQLTLDLSTEWTRVPPRRRARPVSRRRCATRSTRSTTSCSGTSTTASTAAVSPAARRRYDKAYDRLFARLDWLRERLAGQRYLVGDTITEADVRLFTTLARFDAVYHGHFKCNRSKLTEMPVLWAYARDLFQTPGFGDTIDFVQIKQHYYVVHTDINPTQIVPKGPDLAGWFDAAPPRRTRRPPVRRRHPAGLTAAGRDADRLRRRLTRTGVLTATPLG